MVADYRISHQHAACAIAGNSFLCSRSRVIDLLRIAHEPTLKGIARFSRIMKDPHHMPPFAHAESGSKARSETTRFAQMLI